MSILTEIVQTIKSGTTGIGVFDSVIPESEPVPAIAVYNVAFVSDRILTGEKTKKWSQWRITAVATKATLQSVIEQLESLDNTTNQYFRKLYVDLVQIEPKQPSEPHQRAFLDVRVYKR